MSSAEADVVGSSFDIDQGLQQLIARGYQFVHPTDGSGEVQAVVGVRVHDNVVDVVRLNAEDDAEAARLPGSEQNVLAPTSTLWRSRGEASQVLGEVLSLPERPPATAVASANGCWIPGRGSRSKWLAAR